MLDQKERCRINGDHAMTRRWGLSEKVVFVELVAVSVNNDAFAPIGRGAISRRPRFGSSDLVRAVGFSWCPYCSRNGGNNRAASQSIVTGERDKLRTAGVHGN